MSDTVYVLDQVGIRLVKEKTLISDTQLKKTGTGCRICIRHIKGIRP